MFEYIQGTLIQSSPTHVIIDIHGLGYRLHIPFNHFTKLPALKTHVFLFVSTVIREDSHTLFGFLTEQERNLFEHLIGISGIGPKTALALIGHMELNDLKTAIRQGNVLHVCKIPGIGKKTAERLIVEMRDKIVKILGESDLAEKVPLKESRLLTDGASALVNLGYNASQAQKAVKAALQACDKEPELAALITSALRFI